jgi:hypothetical protein
MADFASITGRRLNGIACDVVDVAFGFITSLYIAFVDAEV